VCFKIDALWYSDDDMQSLASLMSLQQHQQQQDGGDDVDAGDDVANMADVADEADVQTCQPLLTDIQQLVSRFVWTINCLLTNLFGVFVWVL